MSFKFEGKTYHLEVCGDELVIKFKRDDSKMMFRYIYFNKENFFLIKIDEDGVEDQIYSFDIQMGKCLEGDCTNHMDNYREMIRLINELIYQY